MACITDAVIGGLVFYAQISLLLSLCFATLSAVAVLGAWKLGKYLVRYYIETFKRIGRRVDELRQLTEQK